MSGTGILVTYPRYFVKECYENKNVVDPESKVVGSEESKIRTKARMPEPPPTPPTTTPNAKTLRQHTRCPAFKGGHDVVV
jgi:hypothetical protein